MYLYFVLPTTAVVMFSSSLTGAIKLRNFEQRWDQDQDGLCHSGLNGQWIERYKRHGKKTPLRQDNSGTPCMTLVQHSFMTSAVLLASHQPDEPVSQSAWHGAPNLALP